MIIIDHYNEHSIETKTTEQTTNSSLRRNIHHLFQTTTET